MLFNNAGFVGATGSLEDTSEAEYDLTMDVLLKSVFFGIKHAAPIMKAQRFRFDRVDCVGLRAHARDRQPPLQRG